MGEMADALIQDGFDALLEGAVEESWYDNDETDDFEDKTCVMVTAKAICVLMDGEEQWIPRSVLGPRNELEAKGDKGLLSVASWFADKECLG